MSGAAWAACAQPDEEVDVITREEAQARAAALLQKHVDEPLTLTDVMDTGYGWVFSFYSTKALESDDPDNELLGIAPVLVLALDGSEIVLGTADTIEAQLREYERENGVRRKRRR